MARNESQVRSRQVLAGGILALVGGTVVLVGLVISEIEAFHEEERQIRGLLQDYEDAAEEAIAAWKDGRHNLVLVKAELAKRKKKEAKEAIKALVGGYYSESERGSEGDDFVLLPSVIDFGRD